MSSFATRISAGVGHEQAVIDRLNREGWLAERFGQALLTEACRNAMKSWSDCALRPTLMRWLPDILACSPMKLFLVDAKCGRTDTPNYDIESASVEAHQAIVDHLYTPVVYVFEDWRVMTPRTAIERGVRRSGSGTTGSGTPFYLIEKRFAMDFSDVFDGWGGAP